MAPKKEKKENKKKPKKEKKSRVKKKTPAKKPARPKKKKTGEKPMIFNLFRWLIVLGLWGMLAASALVAWYAMDLPEITSSPKFERKTSITVKAADGSVITRYGELKSVTVSLDELPSEVIYAVMAIEDRRFYQHFGIDPVGIARAMVRNLLKGGVVQGGSTITQQLAKNLFLSHERTLRRKVQEVLLAVWLEHELTKDEILTAYLNRVYFGSGAYGIEAASKTYFNKSARNLNLRESAMLAGLLKAPTRYSPLNNPDLAKKRTDVVLSAMRSAGYITEKALLSNTGTTFSRPYQKESTSTKAARYFSDYVIDQLDDMIGSPSEDIIVETTLIPEIQSSAENSLEKTIKESGEQKNIGEGAILVMHRSGAIIAMVGGNDYGKSQFNRTTQARRPPGSAFKPIVFLAALEKSWKATSKIKDAPITEGEYRPSNFNDKYYGTVTLQQALSKSLNSASFRLAENVGIGRIINTAKILGIETRLNRDMSLSLGSSGIPMIEMLEAYTVIANQGNSITPYAITRITGQNGEIYYERQKNNPSRQLISSRNAREMTFMLTETVEHGTGKHAKLPGNSYAAGKTGTSQDFRDAWFIGYISDYSAAVWLGNDDNSPMNGVTGGSYPAMIWKDVIMTTEKITLPENITTSKNSSFGSVLGRLLGNVEGKSTSTRSYNQ